MFPDVSQPGCANPNQGHPGRARKIASNSSINMSCTGEQEPKAAKSMNFERIRQEIELTPYSGRF
jgi:hypothetical protein